MEFIEGKELREIITECPETLDLQAVLSYATQIVEGLKAAHYKGIIHRDIKSSNIMITAAGQVKLMDFGLARISGSAHLTQTGTTMGTLAYMSPEQVRGENVDHRSDIFSLGVVLYELVTGELPFQGEYDAALIYEIAHETPPAMREVCEDVPDELQRIVDRAMEKYAEKRYQSVDETLENLEELKRALETGEHLSAGRLRLYTIRKIYRWLVPIAAVFAVIVFLIFKGVDSQAETISIAVLPLEITGSFSEDDAWLTEGISQSIANKLTNLNNVRVTPWVTSQRYRDYSISLRDVASELGVQRLIVGTIRVLGERMHASVTLIDPNANQQLWAGEFEENVSDIFEVQAKIALGSAEGLKGKLSGEEERLMARAPARRADAYELYIKGSLKMQSDTPEDNDVALAYFDKAIELDPELAEAYVGRGAVYGNRFWFGWGGMESLEKSEENFKKALELDPQSTSARRGLITAFLENGLSEECLKQGAAVPQDKLDDIEALSVRAYAYFAGGLPDRAVPLYEKILQLDRANQGALWHLIITQDWYHQWEKVIDAGELFFDRFGEDPEVHTWVAQAYQQLGDLDAARLHIDRALALFGNNPNFWVHLGASDIYEQLGDSAKAKSLLTSSANFFEEILQAHPSNFLMSEVLAVIHARLGNLDETEKFVAHARGTASFPLFNDSVGFLLKSGRTETARQTLQDMLSRGTNVMFALNGPGHLTEETISELKKEGFFDKQVELDHKYRARY
jgi:non-specific serine/threonine protein kinase